MTIIIDFFKVNNNLYLYLLFIVTILIFASLARVLTYFIEILVEKSPFGKRGIARNFTPFLILLFIISGESTFLLLFGISGQLENSFSVFLNSQIIWTVFWLVVALIELGLHQLSVSSFSLRRLYSGIRVFLLLVLLTFVSLRNLDHIISASLGFIVTFLLLRVSYTINQIPLVRKKFVPEEQKIIARWDVFNITLPYNVSKEKIDRAIQVAEKCIKETQNIGSKFTVLLKDLSERGIVIEVKYLVLDSVKMKETKHKILSKTLKSFADEKIPMSPS